MKSMHFIDVYTYTFIKTKKFCLFADFNYKKVIQYNGWLIKPFILVMPNEQGQCSI